MEVSGRRTNDQEETSEAIDEKLCHPCKEDGDLQRAYGYCNNCEEDLCETCYKYHRRPKPFKDHTLVKHDIEEHGRQESREDTDTKPPPLPERKYLNTNCHIHNKEELKYHCRSHDAIICSVCALKQHKECKNIDYIPDVYETENKRVVEIIEYVEGKIEYKLKQETDVVQLAEKSFESAMSAIKAQKGQVDRYFKEKEKYFTDKITAFRNETKGREKEVMDLKQNLKNTKIRVTSSSPDAEVNTYIALQEIETNVNKINKELPGVLTHPTLTMSYEQQQPLPQLGKTAVAEHQGNISKNKIKLLRKVDVARGKTTCSLVDATLLSKGSVLFTDTLNERLIIISDEHEPVFHECLSAPWGVTCISETKVAVSFPYEMKVRFFNINRTISCCDWKSIKLSGHPGGIGYLKSKASLIIAVLTEQSTVLELWSQEGKYMKTVASMDYTLKRMALTADQRILLTSAEKHILCMLDIDGTALKTFEYADDNMKGPFGMASDGYGNIYVCGYNCLRCLTKQGQWKEMLSSADGFGPQSLQICQKTHTMYIGQGSNPKMTQVLVYQI